MRQIELKTITIADRTEGMPDSLDYRDQLLQLLRIPAQGLTIDQMEVPLRIIRKLRASNGAVTLEEDEYKFLLELLNSTQFRIVAPEIVEMRDALKAAPVAPI